MTCNNFYIFIPENFSNSLLNIDIIMIIKAHKSFHPHIYLSFLINFPFPINKLRCNINHIKNLINGAIPFL